MARRSCKGERLDTVTPQSDIDVCLNCPLGSCRPQSQSCPLQGHYRATGRKNLGGMKVV